MDKLATVLREVVARQAVVTRLSEIRLRQTACLVLGEALAGRCEAIEVRGSVLSITTSDRELARQLRRDSEGLLRRLNDESKLPRPVRRLRVSAGRP